MRKYPKNNARSSLIKGAKILIVAEAAFFLSAGAVWFKMCNSQDFRYTMHRWFPRALGGFYWTLETFGKDSTPCPRGEDYRKWGIEDS